MEGRMTASNLGQCQGLGCGEPATWVARIRRDPDEPFSEWGDIALCRACHHGTGASVADSVVIDGLHRFTLKLKTPIKWVMS